MNRCGTVITGGGLSGLITGIALRGMGYNGSILILEQNKYPFKENNAFVITPMARQLLHYMPLYRKHNYCEGRYIVYKLVNKEHKICFEIPDTAITGYSDFISVLCEIAEDNDIEIKQEVKALDYNFCDKYIVTVKREIYFENLVIAEGSKDCSYSRFEGGDADEYEFFIKNDEKSESRKNDNAIYVGSVGGFKDTITDINCTYAILSAFSAAETIYKNKSVKDYLSDVKYLINDIEAAQKLKAQAKGFEFLKDVLMGIRAYSSYL